MIEPRRRGGVMKAGHYLVVAAAAVVAVLIAFAVFSFVAGIVFEVLKIAIVAAIIVAVFWFVSRHARRHT